jgi:hypothetical protein
MGRALKYDGVIPVNGIPTFRLKYDGVIPVNGIPTLRLKYDGVINRYNSIIF